MRALILLISLYSAPMADTGAQSGETITLIVPAVVVNHLAICATTD